MERFEARLEVGNREAEADNSLMSYSVARTERFVDNILADNKANNRFPDEVEEAADRNSRMDSVDMFGNASDAWVGSSRAVEGEGRIDKMVLVLSHHLHDSKMTIDQEKQRKEMEREKDE
jgi:hypothetical protein